MNETEFFEACKSYCKEGETFILMALKNSSTGVESATWVVDTALAEGLIDLRLVTAPQLFAIKLQEFFSHGTEH